MTEDNVLTVTSLRVSPGESTELSCVLITATLGSMHPLRKTLAVDALHLARLVQAKVLLAQSVIKITLKSSPSSGITSAFLNAPKALLWLKVNASLASHLALLVSRLLISVCLVMDLTTLASLQTSNATRTAPRVAYSVVNQAKNTNALIASQLGVISAIMKI